MHKFCKNKLYHNTELSSHWLLIFQRKKLAFYWYLVLHMPRVLLYGMNKFGRDFYIFLMYKLKVFKSRMRKILV